MAIENFNEDVEVIQKLDTLPNQEGGLSAEELKAKFDQAAIAIKNFINNSLLPVVRELEDAKDPSIIYGLDQTLSELGRAADAKAVGDALAGKVGTKDIIGIACGGTGADNAEAARRNLDAAQAEHTHSASDMKTGLLPLERGGTGAGTAAQAMENLGITAALAGKAPAGYGLGGAELKAWADVDSLTKPGFYKFADCELNGGLATMIVHAIDDWTLAQELTLFTYPTRKCTRSCHGGSWREWENDAMKPYPVGAIYMSLDSTSPAELFGGTWERVTDRFLFAAHDATGYPGGATGGEAYHTLTIDEMPSHMHEIPYTPLTTADQAFTWGNENLRGSGYSHWTKECGGNQPHNNMPPYLAVYMWKRVA